MRPFRSQVIGTLVLMVCLVCPILEVFDSWDPPIQAGNDSEYSLVIAALCVGAAYLFVRSIFKFPREGFAGRGTLSFGFLALFISRCFDFCLSDTSPPALPLRI